jgi:L-ascorbate metabolism protein UlaG (beta-lactamase superfamily)
MFLKIILLAVFLIILGVIMILNRAPQFGHRTRGDLKVNIKNSANYIKGKFQNLCPTPMAAEKTSMLQNGLKFLTKSNNRHPNQPIETFKFDKEKFLAETKGFKWAWFGHSSLIFNIQGKIILIDPVFSKRASPFSWIGVSRFEYTHQYSVNDMPEIDLLLISHDHYDHLDYKTILNIHGKVKKFFVPLGVAAHLKHWGVAASKISEFGWWEANSSIEGLEIISAPARHFSGRAGFDKDYTLWCSWIILTENLKIYYSGDSGYDNHFSETAVKYGPFDICFMECGQYNDGWPYIHMMPEESVKASLDLKAGLSVPVHWGKFSLSLHSWTEPIERAKKEAQKHGVKLFVARQGEVYTGLD